VAGKQLTTTINGNVVWSIALKMDLRVISQNLETELKTLFEELRSGIAAREDSRAFGAMIKHQIKHH
jgi:hypothetical protein